MVFDEEAKAIQEAAKVGQMFGSFISRIIGGSLEQGVGIFEDKLKYNRLERAARLERSYIELVRKLGLGEPDKPIALKYAVPLFQMATIEDEDYLQNLWVKLLVKSSFKEYNFDLNRTCIDILERLSSFEAEIFIKIYSIGFDESKNGIDTTALPHEVKCLNINKEINEEGVLNVCFPPEKDFNFQIKDEVLIALENLDRLSCISPSPTFSASKDYSVITQTMLGKKLFESIDIQGSVH